MYFLSRNNTLYHYLAHIGPRRRYMYTGVIFIILVGCSYGVYYYSAVHVIMYEQEVRALEQKCEQEKTMIQNNNQLDRAVERLKQDIRAAVLIKKEEALFTELLFFVLDSARQSGLSVNSYSLQKNKNDAWRKKEKIHLIVMGKLDQVVSFLKVIQQSRKMIAVSDWSLTSGGDAEYVFAGDFSFMSVSA